MRGNMFSDNEVRIQPAPSCLTDKAGQYYVSRGVGEFSTYLRPDGWGKPCYYWRDEDAAKRALTDLSPSAAASIEANIAAQTIETRATKRSW